MRWKKVKKEEKRRIKEGPAGELGDGVTVEETGGEGGWAGEVGDPARDPPRDRRLLRGGGRAG